MSEDRAGTEFFQDIHDDLMRRVIQLLVEGDIAGALFQLKAHYFMAAAGDILDAEQLDAICKAADARLEPQLDRMIEMVDKMPRQH